MPEGNPLVAESKKDPDGPGAFTAGNGDYGWAGGIGIAESSMDAFNGIKDGDWVSGGLGMLSLAGEIAGAAIDPFGYLMSSVASFLMEHVQPLKDMLDSVAGNPPVIQSYADTWGNVSKALGERKTDFDNAVKNGTTGWTGAGADSYRAFAAEHSDALSGAATVAGAISTVTMIMGQVVSFVRETVRQLIADLVGKLIAWVMEEVFSLGFGTPVVVAQATAAIAKWGKKIGELLKKLTDTIRKVSPLLSKLVDIFEKIAKVFGKVLGKVSGLDGLKVKEGGFVHRVSKGEGGGVHARAHGDADSPDADSGSGRDAESAPSHADEGDSPSGHGEDGSPSADGEPSAARSGDSTSRARSGDSGAGDGAPSNAGDSSPAHPGESAPSHAGDSGSPTHAGESAPSRAGDNGGSPSRTGESAPSHVGDSGSPTRAGESAPSRAGDNGGSPSHAGDSSAPPSRAPSHAGDSSPSATRSGDNTPSHAGDSSAARAGDNTPSHAGDSNPSPTRGGDGSPSHAGDSSPARGGGNPPSHAGDPTPAPSHAGDSSPSRSGDNSPAHSGSPSHANGGSPAHSGSAPASRADASGTHPGTETPSSAAPPRVDGTTAASGTAPTAPRTGDPGTQFPSPRGGDGAASGIPPQGGQPMMGGGMPPGGAPGGGGLGGGSPRTGGGAGWTGTPGSPGAHTPHVDAPGRPRPGGDLPEGRPRPRTPDTPAPAARGFGPGTHGPDTRAPGPATRPGHAGPSHTGPGGPGHNGPGGPHDPASGPGPHENGPHENGPDGNPPHHGDSGPLTPDEVNARHAESTPSGSSYHADDPEMGDLPHRVRPDADGRYTVDVHVTPDGHARIGNRLYTPEEFADILRRNGDYDGRPIRLIGCDASSNDFAHRLSRELDTEVMAPTKPAWTDSHGRVFSSDYEIGPDGRMRPRIPPDGEWNTHHPDGSVHPAGEDGFTPDTHESHKHDIDADDAVERGRRPIPAAPVEIETRQPPASMKEKINDLHYRNKYYDGPDTNGEFKRKNAEQYDHNGERVEKIREDTDKELGDRFETKSDDYVPAQYREDIPEVEHKATQAQKDRAQQLIDERAQANAHARDVEKDYVEHRKAGTLTDELEEQRAAAHKARTDYGEELGEHAASDAVADRYPPERYDVKELPDPEIHGDNTRPGGGEKPGAGRFDQIYAVTDRTTGETRHVIVEAKGPNAELGTRKGVDGKTNYEQGHPLYVDSVIANMRKNGTPAEQALADDLEMAKELGQLDYSVAKARVREEVVVGTDGQPVMENGKPVKKPVYGGYNLKHFDMSVTTR